MPILPAFPGTSSSRRVLRHSNSGRIASGAVYRHRFTTPGTYKYVCLPHVDVGMTASVIVDPR